MMMGKCFWQMLLCWLVLNSHNSALAFQLLTNPMRPSVVIGGSSSSTSDLGFRVFFPAAAATARRRHDTVLLAKKLGKQSKGGTYRREIANNRKARFNYEILETIEAGIALVGTEVKSCRSGKVTIRDAFGQIKGNTVWLHNVDIAHHESTGPFFQHEQKRKRQLLLHKSETRKLNAATQQQGNTLIPLSFYFNDKNTLKVELALCRGKNVRDKRETIKRRDDQKLMNRIAKNIG